MSVTLSTMEAEYAALSNAGEVCVYLRNLMSSAGVEQVQATAAHEVSTGALILATTDGYHSRTKHTGVRYHETRYLIKGNVVIAAKIIRTNREQTSSRNRWEH